MLKTVYRSSCRDKHNCQWRDSNLDPLTLQSDALTTRLLRPAIVEIVEIQHREQQVNYLKQRIQQGCLYLNTLLLLSLFLLRFY